MHTPQSCPRSFALPRPFVAVLCALIGSVLLATAAQSAEDFPAGLSHLSVHGKAAVTARAPGRQEPSAPAGAMPTVAAVPPATPPTATTVAVMPPLHIDNGAVVKGFSQVEEDRLARKLAQASLRERLLKVAIFRAGKAKMGLIKVQAGLADTGTLEICAVENDVVKALKAAFDPDLDLVHVDFVAVVPGPQNADNDYHMPVFTVSVSRETWDRAIRLAAATADTSASPKAQTGPDAASVIAALGVTRYAPELIRFAADTGERGQLPASAFADPVVSDRWGELLDQAKLDLPLALSRPVTSVRVIHRGLTNQPRVALTIDDGPHPLITPLVLAALKQANVKATFFIVGKKAEEYPELLRQIVAEGHELGNHTYSHARLSTLSPQQIWAEIRACDDVVSRITGVKMRYLRPPGGGYDEKALRIINAAGYAVGLWTDNTGDWRRPPAQTITHNALRRIAPGGIILMHQGEPVSVEAIPMIVRGLRLQNLEAGTLSSIIDPNHRESLEKALQNQVDEDQALEE